MNIGGIRRNHAGGARNSPDRGDYVIAYKLP
jgi:glucose dehydrogenase